MVIAIYGESTGYRVVHLWVERRLGTPMECENCLNSEPQRYDWANISGQYLRDIADWARLCKRCHALFDYRYGKNAKYGAGRKPGTHCHKGHEYIKENTYQPPNGPRECRSCRQERKR